MNIYFGLYFDDGALPKPQAPTRGVWVGGPRRLLRWLERTLGLGVPEEEVDHLRTEQYRQALRLHLQDHPQAFLAAAFDADDLATAEALLQRRDELLLAGWDFAAGPDLPPRLRVLAELEAYFRSRAGAQLSPGPADRQLAVLPHLSRLRGLVHSFTLCDPLEDCPPAVRRLVRALEAAGVPLTFQRPPASEGDTDLAHWQRFLRGEAPPRALRADGSLLLLRAQRETHIGAYLAQLLRKNNPYRPCVLLPQANRTLDNALIQEGLPSLGVASASSARPSLQVLKLAPVFLWEPLDPYKVMEFVSLGIKPLEQGLADRIAAFLADTPGLFSERWFAMINNYLEQELPPRARRRPEMEPERVRRQYEFWFRRRRVDSSSGRVDKRDVREIFAYLQIWATDTFQQREERSPTLLVLAGQAGRIVDLLDEWPETDLSPLDLERIVRTIYEPAPVRYRQAEARRLDTLQQAGGFLEPVDQLVWWDFVLGEPDYFFSRWYPLERAYLARLGIELDDPEKQNARLIAQRKKPVLHTRQRLVLCFPQARDGKATEPHPLFGDLCACFGEDLAAIALDVDAPERIPAAWSSAFTLPHFLDEAPAPLPRPRPFLRVTRPGLLPDREAETPTSLDRLLYYPHQWFFRHLIQLRQSSILTVVPDSRLFGNLAHRFLERLLAEAKPGWTKTEVDDWVRREAEGLLRKEGATLLLYGREPERIALINHLKYAGWSLLSLLQDNRWRVHATELELEGEVGELSIRGRADLVLERENEMAVIDLKWRGARRFSELLRNEEDLQLALYADLLPPAGKWPHTGFFIINKGRMLVRDNRAFAQVTALVPDARHEDIYPALKERLLRTFRWRKEQLTAGQVEIRCAFTQEELESTYGEALLDLLEMKTEDARYDDYRVLIGLVE